MAVGDLVIKWDHEKLGVVLSPELLNLNSWISFMIMLFVAFVLLAQSSFGFVLEREF